jgi:hypothetical protein
MAARVTVPALAEERRPGNWPRAATPAARSSKAGSRKVPANAPLPLARRGVDKHLADRARKAAALSDAHFKKHVVKAAGVAVAATDIVVRAEREAGARLKRMAERGSDEHSEQPADIKEQNSQHICNIPTIIPTSDLVRRPAVARTRLRGPKSNPSSYSDARTGSSPRGARDSASKAVFRSVLLL